MSASGGTTSRERVLAAAVSAASAIALSGCMPVLASGPMTSEDRAVGDVSTVVLETSGALTISQGDPGLVVHAPENAVGRLTSESDAGTLVLGAAPGAALGFMEIRYDLTLPELATIEVSGSGDATITVAGAPDARVVVNGSGDVSWSGLDSEQVEVRVAGSGDVRLTGSAGEVRIELDGSGDVDAEGLAAADVSVAVRGSGDASVFAEERLRAEIAGSGTVTYTGDPALDTDIWGSGEVVRG